MLRNGLLVGVAVLAVGSCCLGGTGYRVTGSDGAKEETYDVRFGGGRRFEQFTAYDPAAQKFVYLQWQRGTPAPAPAGSVWDHQTGRTIRLYRFPGVAQPLPVIPSIDELRICPRTGGKIVRTERTIIYD